MARELKPCGTWAAYMRHRRKGEEPCEPCRAAARDQAQERKDAKRREASKRRLAAVPDDAIPDLEVREPATVAVPDPLEIARSNLEIIEATLFSDTVSASAIKGLTERREQLVTRIIELSGGEQSEVTSVDDDSADAQWSIEAI